MPESALRLVRSHVTALVEAGFDEPRAYDVLRAVWSYAFGSAFAEISWDTPEDLAAVADVVCGQSDSGAQFALGLDLMLRGLDEPRGLTLAPGTGCTVGA